jgi:hypothetical protein
MSSVGRPPVATLGRARTCPHCKATVLESANVCPGCRHHLRFDAAGVAREEVAFTAWKVDGVIGPRSPSESCEYQVVVALRNEEGREIARHVVAVGALQPHERRAFTLAVELIPPRSAAVPRVEVPAPAAARPIPSAPNRPLPAPPPPPGATIRPALDFPAGFVEPRMPAGMPPRSGGGSAGRPVPPAPKPDRK